MYTDLRYTLTGRARLSLWLGDSGDRPCTHAVSYVPRLSRGTNSWSSQSWRRTGVVRRSCVDRGERTHASSLAWEDAQDGRRSHHGRLGRQSMKNPRDRGPLARDLCGVYLVVDGSQIELPDRSRG